MKNFPEKFETAHFKFVSYTFLSESQSRELWQARNDWEIRKWMVNKTPIPWEDHLSFMGRLATLSDRIYYAVFSVNGDLVGSQCLNPLYSNTEGESGLYILPQHQGKGLGKLMKGEFIDFLFSNNLLQTVTEKVRHENTRNNQLNLSMGFDLIGKDDEYCYYQLNKKAIRAKRNE